MLSAEVQSNVFQVPQVWGLRVDFGQVLVLGHQKQLCVLEGLGPAKMENSNFGLRKV